ncbi:MAG: YdcF family protein [Bryobacterales bacterium]|nr:YdcF family protein [Bryobacterales bacterium]
MSSTPLVRWWATWLSGPWTDAKGDILVVLAGSSMDGTVLGESSYLRAVYAVWAYKQDGFRQVLVSGGAPGGKENEASLMRDFLVASGVPASAIRLETLSTSTRENAVSVSRMLAAEPRRKVLLTSDFHMFRASRAFKRAGLEIVPRPFPDAIKRSTRWPGRWTAFLTLVEETVKIGYYFARGWI